MAIIRTGSLSGLQERSRAHLRRAGGAGVDFLYTRELTTMHRQHNNDSSHAQPKIEQKIA
jgi:hypothetical protein